MAAILLIVLIFMMALAFGVLMLTSQAVRDVVVDGAQALWELGRVIYWGFVGVVSPAARAQCAALWARMKLITVTVAMAILLIPILIIGSLWYGNTDVVTWIVTAMAFISMGMFMINNSLRKTTVAKWVGMSGPANGFGLLTIYLSFLAVVARQYGLNGNLNHWFTSAMLVGMGFYVIGILKSRSTHAPHWLVAIAALVVFLASFTQSVVASHLVAESRLANAWVDFYDTGTNDSAATTENKATNRKAKINLPAQAYAPAAGSSAVSSGGELQVDRLKTKAKDATGEHDVNDVLKVNTIVLRFDPKAKEYFVMLDSASNRTPVRLIRVYRLDEVGEIIGEPIYVDQSKVETISEEEAVAALTPAPKVEPVKITPAVPAAQVVQSQPIAPIQPAPAVAAGCTPILNGNTLTLPGCFSGEYDLGSNVSGVTAINGGIDFGGRRATASGSPIIADNTAQLVGAPFGVVLAKMEGKDWIWVKPGTTFNTGGNHLFVRINDSKFTDNSGAYTLEITRK